MKVRLSVGLAAVATAAVAVFSALLALVVVVAMGEEEPYSSPTGNG